MKRGTFISVLIGGALAVTATGVAVPGSSRHSPGSAESQAMTARSGAEAPLLAPNDYLEFLESSEAIGTGSLTAPGVEPTVIPGPIEPVVTPEGG